uniref:Uncharacterized protein n=1 Tax=Anguilla anguilla TaxID=7936 RepID=A0A0E9Q9B5_ANGAN
MKTTTQSAKRRNRKQNFPYRIVL